MRRVFLSILFLPSICAAVGPEEVFYLAAKENGQFFKLEWIEGAPLQDDNYIYGSENQYHRYCWETASKFQCSSALGNPPKIIYRRGLATGEEYKRARKQFRLTGHKDDQFGYFVCEKGCSLSAAKWIFFVSQDEC